MIWHDLRLRKENEHWQKIKEELRSKQLGYAKLIKETIKPRVDPKKKLEMDFLRQSADHRGVPANLVGMTSPGTSSSFARAMSSVHSQGDLWNNTADDEDSSYDSSESSVESIQNIKTVNTERKWINWKIDNPMVPKPKRKKSIKTVDWLQQRRLWW